MIINSSKTVHLPAFGPLWHGYSSASRLTLRVRENSFYFPRHCEFLSTYLVSNYHQLEHFLYSWRNIRNSFSLNLRFQTWRNLLSNREISKEACSCLDIISLFILPATLHLHDINIHYSMGRRASIQLRALKYRDFSGFSIASSFAPRQGKDKITKMCCRPDITLLQ